jgi:hypothetical protein
MGFVDKSDRMVSSYGIARRNVEVDQETVFSLNRHDHSQCISYIQIMWQQIDAQKFP